MSNTAYEELRSALWKDVNSDARPWPLLAHYTTPYAFEQIVKNEELWLSHPFYMNDHEELRWGIEQGVRRFRESSALREACKDAETFARLTSKFDQLTERFVLSHSADIYVLCLSAHDREDNDGRLSMWRGYGANGNGICFVLDFSKLPQNDNSPLLFGPVDYRSSAERLEWWDSRLSEGAQFLCSVGAEDVQLDLLAKELFERLCIASIYSKHRGFKEEGEWRVVFWSPRPGSADFARMQSYAATATGMQPKLKLSLKRDSGVIKGGVGLCDLIDRVIVGPSQAGRLAVNTVGRMLAELDRPSLSSRVLQSSIPYRP